MISVAEAIHIVVDKTTTLPTERVPLDATLARTLGEDIVADSDLPPFHRAQMDGYALRAADIVNTPAQLRIVGESIAGRGWHHELQEREAVRIMTGAPVPAGADTVQQVELTCELRDGSVVEVQESVTEGKSIVKRGSEVQAGAVVLRSGVRINAAMMAALASFGYAEVMVGQKPRVAILATGTELVSVEQKPGPDQIRDSNNFSLYAFAQLAGATVERLPLAGDDIELLKRQISEAAECSDVVITSGGVSMGRYDFTKNALQELGAELFFERVALRPGKPTVFARLPNRTLVFSLPGNPVSVSVTFNLFARVALLLMQGATESTLTKETAIIARDVKGSLDRESYLPAELTTNDDGQLVAFPLKWGGSSDFVAFALATGLIIIPAGTTSVHAESIVKVVRLPE
ncbi:MAG: gephyrin-like molybdotransferase Glp [Pyrinomonadaceae bacterium]